MTVAIGFANNNIASARRQNANTALTPKLCAIYAIQRDVWRNAQTLKALIPESLVRDSSDATTKQKLETNRVNYLARVFPPPPPSSANAMRFALLGRTQNTGQLLIPTATTNLFTAVCVDPPAVPADGSAPAIPAAFVGATTFPQFSYVDTTLQQAWGVRPADNGLADAVVAAAAADNQNECVAQ